MKKADDEDDNDDNNSSVHGTIHSVKIHFSTTKNLNSD